MGYRKKSYRAFVGRGLVGNVNLKTEQITWIAKEGKNRVLWMTFGSKRNK